MQKCDIVVAQRTPRDANVALPGPLWLCYSDPGLNLCISRVSISPTCIQLIRTNSHLLTYKPCLFKSRKGSVCVFSHCPLPILVSPGCVVSGAGAFEVAVADALVKHKPNVKGRAQLGVQAFADALLIIPKVSGSCRELSVMCSGNMVLFMSCVFIHSGSTSLALTVASSFIGSGPQLWL